MATLRRLALGSALAVLAVSGIHGAEPDGRLEIRAGWILTSGGTTAGPPPGGLGRLRVTIRSVAAIRAATVRIGGPPEISISVRNTEIVPGDPIAIGDLEPGEIRSLELDIRAPASGGGIVSVRILAEDGDGENLSEGIGVAVGSPGETPRVRHGAREFRARPPTDGAR